ncbi:MAG: Os1348 family NHLP clan protein [Labilithrix sp.]
MSDITSILERALADGAYLERLLADPNAAAAEVGAKLSDDEAAAVKGMTADEFRQFAAEYAASTDPAKRRAAC